MKREDKQAILDEMKLLHAGTLPTGAAVDPLGLIEALLSNYEYSILTHVDSEEGIRRLLTPLLVVKHIVKQGYTEYEEEQSE